MNLQSRPGVPSVELSGAPMIEKERSILFQTESDIFASNDRDMMPHPFLSSSIQNPANVRNEQRAQSYSMTPDSFLPSLSEHTNTTLMQMPLSKDKKIKSVKKRGRPSKVQAESIDSVSSDPSKSRSGLKRSSKEQNKSGTRSKPIDPKRRERNRTLARESRKRKKEYIQSLEEEIKSLKDTVSDLRSELASAKQQSSFPTHSLESAPLDAKQCIQQEVMKHMESMVNASKKFQNNDLKDCISYLEANHGPLSNDRKTLLRKNIKTLIDKLIPDFVKCVFVRSEDQIDFRNEDYNKMMRCSKYQFNEIVQKRNISDWEKCFVLMNLDKEQRDKMFELKNFAQKSRKTYSVIVKNLLIIKDQIFQELKKTNTMFDSIRNCLSDVQIAKFLLWVKSDGVSSVDRYKLWGINRKSRSQSKNSDEEEPYLTDSEQEDGSSFLFKAGDENSCGGLKFPNDHDSSILPHDIPGFGNMIKNFWSKYIYNGFKDMYNKGKGVLSIDENEELGNRMYEEYQDFRNEVDLIKDMNQSKELGSEPEFNLDLEIDGLERLC